MFELVRKSQTQTANINEKNEMFRNVARARHSGLSSLARKRFQTKALLLLIIGTLLFSLVIASGQCSILSISKVSIDPTGYEDQSTQEWKGSFWTIAATVDTKESYLLFNASVANMSGLDDINGETVTPTSAVKITITPEQPYWEIPLSSQYYMVYPKTYGTHLNTLAPNFPSKTQDSVPELDLATLEPALPYQCNLYTPIDITVEKIGNDSFTQTVHIDTLGGTDTIVVSNPADSSEKVLIQDLGKLYTGISTPSLEDMLIINNFTAFQKSSVINAINYGRDATGKRVTDECYAFYWFGGGNYTVYDGEVCPVYSWNDGSPEFVYWHQDTPAIGSIPAIGHNCIFRDNDFPGVTREPDVPGFLNLYSDQYAVPIAASIAGDNPNHNSYYTRPVWSLVDYLQNKFPSSVLDLNYLQQGWTITSDNKLRIYAPIASVSSLITMKISTELVDSVVYQPIAGCGRCEQAYWDSSKTASASIKDSDTAILKVKQDSSQSSKITVTTSVSPDIPVSVSPLMDSAIQDPGTVHDFQFEIRNLGTTTKQNGTVTFTMKNDLGTVTDTQTLDFELLPSGDTAVENAGAPATPLWAWFVAVATIAAGSVAVYGLYRFRSRGRKGSNYIPPPPPPSVAPSQMASVSARDGQVARKRKFHRKILAASLILLIIFVSLGAYYYDAYHKLGVGLIGVGLGDVGYTSAEIRLTLEVRNPNLLPVYIPSGDFEITINDQRLGSGHFGSVMVWGNGHGSIVVPITFYATDLPLVVFGLITGGGNVTIKIDGSANVLLFGVPFSSTLYNVKLT